MDECKPLPPGSAPATDAFISASAIAMAGYTCPRMRATYVMLATIRQVPGFEPSCILLNGLSMTWRASSIWACLPCHPRRTARAGAGGRRRLRRTIPRQRRTMPRRWAALVRRHFALGVRSRRPLLLAMHHSRERTSLHGCPPPIVCPPPPTASAPRHGVVASPLPSPSPPASVSCGSAAPPEGDY